MKIKSFKKCKNTKKLLDVQTGKMETGIFSFLIIIKSSNHLYVKVTLSKKS
jgi:hypothetical protein